MRFVALALCLIPIMSIAADATKPHPHKGKLKAYEGEPPAPKLSADQLKQINADRTVYTHTSEDSGGSAVAVFKVNASPEAVRKIIADFDSYPKWIDTLKLNNGGHIHVYKREGDKVYVEFTIVVKKFFISSKYTYFIEHNFPLEKKGWGTWKLDYSRHSDFDDNIGFWRVDPVEGNPNQALVSYSVSLMLNSSFIDMFRSWIVDEGLKEATQWVKKAAASLPTAPPKTELKAEPKSETKTDKPVAS